MEHAELLANLVVYATGLVVSWTKIYDEQPLSKRMSMSLAWPLVVTFIIISLLIGMLDAVCEILILAWKNGVVPRWRATQLKLKARQRRM